MVVKELNEYMQNEIRFLPLQIYKKLTLWINILKVRTDNVKLLGKSVDVTFRDTGMFEDF